MNVKTESKTTIEATMFIEGTEPKTHPTRIGSLYHGEICESFDLNKMIEELSLFNGEYKITITIEKETQW